MDSRIPRSAPSATQCDALDFERTYPMLAEITFDTRMIRLDLATANALRRRCEESRHSLGRGELVDEDDGCVLDALAQAVDSAMTEMGIKHAFVRLSTRSPKDARIQSGEAMSALIDEALCDFASENNGFDASGDSDAVVASVIRACAQVNAVASGSEAVELLGSSRRVFQDLIGRLLMADDDDSLELAVLVRAWADDVFHEQELRCWVYSRRLTAVTQYYKAPYLAALDAARASLVPALEAWFATELLPRLPPEVDTCVVDILPRCIFTPHTGDHHFYLVELNHWAATTSSSLFDWASDAELLCSGGDGGEVVWRIRLPTACTLKNEQ
ncbi:uncharacterized protein AMSG_06661 [Thecamonas trahens ATCC 50062]|uniref:Cell division cycle protein 123 n=1 Tax=Thecamonas trahens ATCC 50062 TaxID=461836 RepID=A0A0L0DHH9_THETB|nr:hypothetical protein AMSG_06661 [Thecamonas trahens ATCC 50062]KNC50768.1 hypothetical protein AMSG_06661 [Thecamonas trahens ATCC 50062]|eukprot:XP_013756730.1 hypothetical protein AMSG_06661 [Thecamonas trahens ATCC 50062]